MATRHRHAAGVAVDAIRLLLVVAAAAAAATAGVVGLAAPRVAAKVGKVKFQRAITKSPLKICQMT